MAYIAVVLVMYCYWLLWYCILPLYCCRFGSVLPCIAVVYNISIVLALCW